MTEENKIIMTILGIPVVGIIATILLCIYVFNPAFQKKYDACTKAGGEYIRTDGGSVCIKKGSMIEIK